MIVRSTITPARVKPRSRCLPILVGRSIETVSGGGAVHVIDAGRAGGIVGRRLGGGIVRIGALLDFLPVGLSGHRIFGEVTKIAIRLQSLQAVGILLFVGVIVVDRFAHLMEVVLQ